MARKRTAKRSLTVRIPESYHDLLGEVAQERGIDISSLVNQIIAEVVPSLRDWLSKRHPGNVPPAPPDDDRIKRSEVVQPSQETYPLAPPDRQIEADELRSELDRLQHLLECRQETPEGPVIATEELRSDLEKHLQGILSLTTEDPSWLNHAHNLLNSALGAFRRILQSCQANNAWPKIETDELLGVVERLQRMHDKAKASNQVLHVPADGLRKAIESFLRKLKRPQANPQRPPDIGPG
jgi:hypothetical protein